METSNGYLILNKPSGLTSFKVLRELRKKIPEIQKLGHAGTLDAFATGVLICLAGTYTGLSNYFMAEEKQYKACIEFGKETETLDPQGSVIKTGAVPEKASVVKALEQFQGVIMQVPPLYSAIHVHGKRAYERVLKQELFELPPRPVTIYSIALEHWNPPYATISVHCSKGTYIRALARDIGIACDTCAYVKELQRTRVGCFSLDEAVEFPKASASDIKTVTPITAQELGLVPILLETISAKAVGNGIPLKKIPELSTIKANGNYALFSGTEVLLAVARKEQTGWHYEKVMVGVS